MKHQPIRWFGCDWTISILIEWMLLVVMIEVLGEVIFRGMGSGTNWTIFVLVEALFPLLAMAIGVR